MLQQTYHEKTYYKLWHRKLPKAEGKRKMSKIPEGKLHTNLNLNFAPDYVFKPVAV
jgi:hypothetical protein